jgi:hypothetical protein
MSRDPDGDEFPTVAPNAGELPYAIKAPRGELAWSVLLFGGGGLLLFAMGIVDAPFRARFGAVQLYLVSVAMGWVCALRVWRLGTHSLIFHADRLEVRETRGWRSLARADIAGVGGPARNLPGSRFLIYPRPRGGAPVRLRSGLRGDPVIGRWLAGAPDVAAKAADSDRATAPVDPRRAVARSATIVFNLTALAVAAWLGALGKLDAVSVGLAAGVLAIGAAWRSGPVMIGAAAPFAALVMRAFLTVQLIDPWPAMAAAAAIALVAGVLVAVRPAAPAKAILVGVLAAIGAYGALIVTNVAFDSTAAAGRSLCIVGHPGALGTGWFNVSGCAAGA